MSAIQNISDIIANKKSTHTKIITRMFRERFAKIKEITDSTNTNVQPHDSKRRPFQICQKSFEEIILGKMQTKSAITTRIIETIP